MWLVRKALCFDLSFKWLLYYVQNSLDVIMIATKIYIYLSFKVLVFFCAHHLCLDNFSQFSRAVFLMSDAT